MKRRKHKKDTRASTCLSRWLRAKGTKYGPFKQGDYRIEAILKKKKTIDK